MKTSPLFGSGYYYPPQMAAHLQFMPHPAMMNMAMNGHLQPRPNGIMDGPKDLSSPIKDLSIERLVLCDFYRCESKLPYFTEISPIQKNVLFLQCSKSNLQLYILLEIIFKFTNASTSLQI